MKRTQRLQVPLLWTCVITIAFICIENFGPEPEEGVIQETHVELAKPKVRRGAFVPNYIYAHPLKDGDRVEVPEWYIPHSKMVYKSSSEDIPDEEWIKNTESRFFFKFNHNDDSSTKSANNPADPHVGPNGPINDGKTNPQAPKKDEVTWQVIDREGRGKIQYYGPVKMEAEYNVGTGESVLKVIQPLNKDSQLSIEANSKDSAGMLNYHLSW